MQPGQRLRCFFSSAHWPWPSPGPTAAFASYLIHADLSGLSRSVTFGNFVVGLVCWTAGVALTFWLFAAIYNRLIGVGAPAAIAPRPAAQRA